jgi:hypothetical protein
VSLQSGQAYAIQLGGRSPLAEKVSSTHLIHSGQGSLSVQATCQTCTRQDWNQVRANKFRSDTIVVLYV